MMRPFAAFALTALASLILLMSLLMPLQARAQSAFPGAEGFGAVASGGRGGQVLYVTTLDPDPAGTQTGSLNWALRQTGPRYILFKVSGVIQGYANVVNGDVTLAGQTSPGGIIVRGLVCDGHYDQNSCSNLIVRHLRIRPGWNLALPPGADRLDDGLRLDGLERFIFDHVSIAHAADEALQISWAAQGTIQKSVLAETVGDHADRGGALLNYSHPDHPQDQLSLIKNLWYRIGGRLPEITCEASNYPSLPGLTADCQGRTLDLEVSNNYYFDPGFLIWYNRDVDQNVALGPYRVAANLVNNHMQVRSDFPYGFALHDLIDVSSNQFFASGNTLSRYPGLSDYQLFYCCNDFGTNAPNTDLGSATRLNSRLNHGTITYWSQAELKTRILAEAGARPLDPMDRRIQADVQDDSIDPTPHNTPLQNDTFNLDFSTPPTAAVDTDNDGMPDSFEQQHAAFGLNPNAADHNGTQLSLPLTGVAGYTNLEVYLNQLADGGGAAPGILFANGFEN